MVREDDVVLRKLLGDVLGTVEDEAKEAGLELAVDSAELLDYATDRAKHLARMLAAKEPAFEEMIRREKDNIALKAGLLAVEQSVELRERLIGMIHGGLVAVLGTAGKFRN
jgi:hypothetical protein